MLDAFARHQRRRNAGFDLATPPRDAIEEAETLVSRIFGPEPWREFSQDSLLALWQRAHRVARGDVRLLYLFDFRKAVDWIPDFLFDTINLPQLRVRTGADDSRPENIALPMATAATEIGRTSWRERVCQ